MDRYGKRQVIPHVDTLRPEHKPMVLGNIKNWETYWSSRPTWGSSSFVLSRAKVIHHYLTWMTLNCPMRREEARCAEKHNLAREEEENKRCRSLEDVDPRNAEAVAESYKWSIPYFLEPKSRSIKNRLGSKKMPVWKRLEKVPSPPRHTLRDKIIKEPAARREEEEREESEMARSREVPRKLKEKEPPREWKAEIDQSKNKGGYWR